MEITINKDLCIGCGLCTTIAEKTFKLDDDGKVGIINPNGNSEEKIKEAAESCPVGAIKIS